MTTSVRADRINSSRDLDVEAQTKELRRSSSSSVNLTLISLTLFISVTFGGVRGCPLSQANYGYIIQCLLRLTDIFFPPIFSFLFRVLIAILAFLI